MKNKNKKNIFHRLKGLRKIGYVYQCYNCREIFPVYEDIELKCPTCGNKKIESFYKEKIK